MSALNRALRLMLFAAIAYWVTVSAFAKVEAIPDRLPLGKGEFRGLPAETVERMIDNGSSIGEEVRH